MVDQGPPAGATPISGGSEPPKGATPIGATPVSAPELPGKQLAPSAGMASPSIGESGISTSVSGGEGQVTEVQTSERFSSGVDEMGDAVMVTAPKRGLTRAPQFNDAIVAKVRENAGTPRVFSQPPEMVDELGDAVATEAPSDIPQIDPRWEKVITDYRALSPITPEEISRRSAEGKWSPADEAHYRQSAILHQMDLMKDRYNMLKEGGKIEGDRRINKIDALLGPLQIDVQALDEKVKAGQATSDEYQQCVEKVNELNSLVGQRESLVAPYRLEMQEIEAANNYLRERLYDADRRMLDDPDVQRRMAFQVIADKDWERASKLVEKGDYINPTVIDQYIAKPVVNEIRRFGGNVGASLLRASARVTPGEEAETNLRNAAEWFSEGLRNLESQNPTVVKQSLLDDDWNVREGWLPKFMKAGTYMGLLAAGGASGGAAGMGAMSMVGASDDYYREGIDSGMSPGEAEAFSLGMSGVETGVELINLGPFVNSGARREIAKNAIKSLKSGKTMSGATGEIVKYAIKQGVMEGPVEEVLTDLGQNALKMGANLATGSSLDTGMTMKDLSESAIMGFVLGGLMGGAGQMSQRPAYKESIRWAVDNQEEFLDMVHRIVPKEQQAEVLEKYDKYRRIFNGLPPAMPKEAANTIAAAISEKQRIKEEQSKTTLDELVASISGDRFEEAMKAQDEIIAEAMGVDLVDIARKEESDRLREQYDKAKLKSEVTGEPMPEGMKKPKEVKLKPKVVEAGEEVVAEVLPEKPQEDAVQVGQAEEISVQPEAVSGEEVRRAQPEAKERQPARSAEKGAVAPEPTPKDELDEALGLTEGGPMEQRPSSRPAKTGKPNTDKAVKAMSAAAPGFKVVAPNTKAEYSKAVESFPQAVRSSWGLYDPKTNTAYVNPEGPDLKNTLFHETAHPLLAAFEQNFPEKFKQFYDEIRTERGGMYRKFAEENYKDKSEGERMHETMAQFMADVADGKVPVSTKPDSLWQKFKAWIQDVLATLGWDTRKIDLSKPDNVRAFAAQFKRAMDKGIKITGLKPVEKSDAKTMLQDDADRLVDGWYSRLDQAVAAKGNTQSGADWMRWAEARSKEGMLSMEEVKWTGLADFLQGKAKVTPKEVRDFLKENRVKVEVVEKNDSDVRINEVSDNEIEVMSNENDALLGTFDSIEEANEFALQNTKFSQYQLPGGSNYREVLVTLPVKKAPKGKVPDLKKEGWSIRIEKTNEWTGQMDFRVFKPDGSFAGMRSGAPIMTEEEALREWAIDQNIREGEKADRSLVFKSSHFDEPNILVHLRLNDRTDADGKKVLFIEELQSDWGASLRKEDSAGMVQRAKDAREKWQAERKRLAKKYGVEEVRSTDLEYPEFNHLKELHSAMQLAEQQAKSATTPSAPFVTSTDAWVDLGMKQAIRMAVEGGYDKISWTTGTQQNERYDLSKQVKEINWTKYDDGVEKPFKADRNVYIEGINGGSWSLDVGVDGVVVQGPVDMAGKRLDEVVGKDMADKIMSQESGDLSGDGLKVGGSGMKGFYDRILPTVAKKVSKKLGGDGAVSDVELRGLSPDIATKGMSVSDPGKVAVRKEKSRDSQQSISITAAMRESVGFGVPLMQKADANRAAALFKERGMTAQQAKEYMESRGVDPEVAKEVVSKLSGEEAKKEEEAPNEPIKEETKEKKAPKEAKEEGEEREHATVERIKREDPELHAALILDPGAVNYMTLPANVSLDRAIALVRDIGPDKASLLAMDEDNDLPAAVRVKVARAAIRSYLNDRDIDGAAGLSRWLLKHLSNAGQVLRASQDAPEIYSKEVIFRIISDEVEALREHREKRDAKRIKKIKKGLQDAQEQTVEDVIRMRKVKGKVVDAAMPVPGSPPNQPKPKKQGYGRSNRVFTKAKYDNAWKEMESQMLSGIPPQLITIAGYHIEAGARAFADVAVEVIKRGGRKMLPYLKGAYLKAAEELGIDPTPESEIDEYIAKANTDSIVEKFRKAIASKDAKAQTDAIEALQQVAKDNGLWGLYREQAIERLSRMAESAIKEGVQQNAAVDEFTKGLIRNLTAQMQEEAERTGLEKPKSPPKRSDIEVIGDAYKNVEKYNEVWAKTQNEFKAKLRAAEARLAKADTPEAKAEAQSAIDKESAKLEKLDRYFGDLLVKPFSEKGLGRAVKSGMKDLDIKIDNIIRQHYTMQEGAKMKLQDRLVTEAGLSGEEAESLAHAVGREFDKLALERKREVIERYMSRGERKRIQRGRKTLEQELIELSNLGAFSDAEFIEKYGDMMGWPKLTAQNIDDIEALSDKIERAPDGRPKIEATEDLLSYQANLKGVSKAEIAQYVWYANTLSGFQTQEVNFLANLAQIGAEAAVAVTRGLLPFKGADGKYHYRPQDTAKIAAALGYGFRHGFVEGMSTLRTGYSPIKVGKVDIPPVGERHEFTGAGKIFSKHKYVRRVMVAADVLFYEAAKELRAQQLAMREAKSIDPSGAVRQRALEILNLSDDQVQVAKDQAQSEYENEVAAIEAASMSAKEKKSAMEKAKRDRTRRVYELVERGRPDAMKEEAARFASRATYNYVPEGLLGAAAFHLNGFLNNVPVLKYIIPFVNIIANVANETVNYTPWGVLRAMSEGSVTAEAIDRMGGNKRVPAALKKQGLTDEQKADIRADLYVKAAMGMALMTMLFIGSDGDHEDPDPEKRPWLQITANGYGNWKKNSQLVETTGWQPYSIKVGDTWYSYQYTPLFSAFNLVGHYRDAQNYRKEKIDDNWMTLWGIMASRSMGSFMDATMVGTIGDVLSDAKGRGGENFWEDMASGLTKTVKGFVIPALYTQTARGAEAGVTVFGEELLSPSAAKEVRGDAWGYIIQDLPWVRNSLNDKLNWLGDPIPPKGGFLHRLISEAKTDPIAKLINKQGWVPSVPSPQSLKVYDPKIDKERVLTSDEQFRFFQIRGAIIKEDIFGTGKDGKSNLEEYMAMDPEEFAKEMTSLQSQAKQDALDEIVGF